MESKKFSLNVVWASLELKFGFHRDLQSRVLDYRQTRSELQQINFAFMFKNASYTWLLCSSRGSVSWQTEKSNRINSVFIATGEFSVCVCVCVCVSSRTCFKGRNEKRCNLCVDRSWGGTPRQPKSNNLHTKGLSTICHFLATPNSTDFTGQVCFYAWNGRRVVSALF